MKNKNAYEGMPFMKRIQILNLYSLTYKERSFKRIFVGNIIEDWLNAVEYNYKFCRHFHKD